VNGFRLDPFFQVNGVGCGWKENDMESTFHDEERQPRTVLRARAAAERQETDEDRERVVCAVIAALDPFPEAREAVIAALRAGRAAEISG
jgi:hypothetical protein